MSTRSIRMAAGAAVLALAMMAPSALAWGGGIELEKNCSNGLGVLDTTQCSYNVAAPSGHQDVQQDAYNVNVAIPVQAAGQKQINKQDVDANVRNIAFMGEQEPKAVAVAKSGDATANGHNADVHVFAPQFADAGVHGSMSVSSSTGSADIEHSGNGDTRATGGNTGNTQDAEAKIEGEDARAVARGAIARGGNGGSNDGANGGDVKRSGNGGWAIDATIASAESEGGNGGSVGCCSNRNDDKGGRPSSSNNDKDENGCCNTGGNGGNAGNSSVTGGDATGGAGAGSTAGNGGNQWAGAGANGGTAANIALAKNVGDNANSQAWNNATSGNSSMGNTMGNYVVGGLTGGNTTYGVMAGGSATNILGVAVNQSGNVTSTSGTATQNGSPSATSSNCLTQSGSPWVSQSQNPGQSNSMSGGAVSQNAGSTQSAGQTAAPRTVSPHG